ncbi:Lsr2 family protein [uncultured Jatrophihabitans sp.]|uniref:histone-like nucleoid-structuring protein Lsr2 n=1 Tax=uncultured Jatrophihabitans sp. TaxID=1610747 RepID=UPI0035CA9A0D
MAKKIVTTTEFTDDLDGGVAAGTVSFSFDGSNFEIDLSKKNRNAMQKALKPYIEHARKTRSARTRHTTTSTANRRSDLAAIRTWATDNGFKVSERGRISQEVTQAYNAAH